MADRLQRELGLFHDQQYGSRKGRSATGSMMITLSKAQRSVKKGDRAFLLGKDIVSAFNNVRRESLISRLRE